MRLTTYTSVALSWALVLAYGFARPPASAASDDRYAAYYQGADDELENDEADCDEPPLPQEPSDDMSDEELRDDETPDDDAPDDDEFPSKAPLDDEPLEPAPDEMPDVEAPDDEAPAGEMPFDEMPDEAPDQRGPPTPVMEADDELPSQLPPRRPTARPYDEAATPKPDAGNLRARPSAPSHAAHPGATGWPANCCGDRTACWGKQSACQPCGHGNLWCRLFGRATTPSCACNLRGCNSRGCNSSCRNGGSGCHCKQGHKSCCGGNTASHDAGDVAPPVPPEPAPYNGATVNSTRNHAAVSPQHWDMPRMTWANGNR
jgi:hypothetical protein